MKIYLAYLNSLTFSCVQMILYTTIPYISDETSVDTSNIIAAISVGSLIFAFMGPFWAARSDQLGRRKVLSFAMFGMSLSFALLASLFIFNDSLSINVKVMFVFMSRIIYGLFCSALVPVSQAWQLDLCPGKEHLKVLTRNSMFLNLGRILGPILVLFKQVNFELVIYGATLWGFSLAAFVLLISSEKKYEAKKEVKLVEVINKWKENIKESYLPILLALIFTAFIGVLHSFLGHHIKTSLKITGNEATIIFAKLILVLSISAVILQQLSIVIFKSGWLPRLFIGSISLVLGTYIMMSATSIEKIWLSIGLISIATAFIPPVYLSLTSHSKDNNEKTNIFGKKLGIASVAHSLGYAVGAGLIAISMKMNIVSESIVVHFISICITLIAVMMYLKLHKTQNHTALKV